jgi:hypothetical protein
MCSDKKLFRTLLSIILISMLFIQGYANVSAIEQEPKTPGLTVSTFDIDVTPPVGSFLSYDPNVNSWDLGLRAKGIVLSGAGQPVVLVAIDWLGIDGESYNAFRTAVANGAGTIPSRVAVQTLHQHDAPRSNFAAERILNNAGLKPETYEGTFQREVIKRLEVSVKNCLKNGSAVTHIGFGEAQVFKVASNRRILDDNGKVRAGRMTTCRDSLIRAEPEGVIDPMVSVISFWNNSKPVAVLSYYATHPQSYYRLGVANPDYPGVARFYRQLAVPDALHIHFTGAGGNVGAGKYNDGSHENRGILAERLADGMKRAWESTKIEPLIASQVEWSVVPVLLPLPESIKKIKSEINLKDTTLLRANAKKIAWLQRSEKGEKLDISCLSLGRARILNMPGELFVEYQLAAKAMRPDLFVAMAAYGDSDPAYIGTALSYDQGGYEIGVSNVTNEAEGIIMAAISKLLKSNQKGKH